nr:beta-lactamase family protein [Gemmatimonadales bacterium]
MPHVVTRRRFVAAGAGALLATLHPPAWLGAQASSDTAGPGRIGPRWLPSGALLHGLPRLLELATVPGLALATVDGGRIWSRGFGRAGDAGQDSVSNDTVFEAASLGKPLFAYAVLRLVDRRLLDLDRPLWRYLEFPDGDNPRMRKVTPRHVLSHTTGLPNWRQAPGPLEPSGEPGRAFSYSGEAIFCLQRVVEAVTRRPFARFMREEVLDPLGMRESSYVWRPGFEGRMAEGHDADGKPLEVFAAIGRRTAAIADDWKKPLEEWRYEDAARAVPLVNPAWPTLPIYMVPNAAASLFTTASDYVRFLARVVARGSEPGLELSEASRRAMTTPAVTLNRALSWGLGWGLQR